jgi:hypothetical protein
MVRSVSRDFQAQPNFTVEVTIDSIGVGHFSFPCLITVGREPVLETSRIQSVFAMFCVRIRPAWIRPAWIRPAWIRPAWIRLVITKKCNESELPWLWELVIR